MTLIIPFRTRNFFLIQTSKITWVRCILLNLRWKKIMRNTSANPVDRKGLSNNPNDISVSKLQGSNISSLSAFLFHSFYDIPWCILLMNVIFFWQFEFLIFQALRITWARDKLLSFRPKTWQIVIVLFHALIYSCRPRGAVIFTLSFTTISITKVPFLSSNIPSSPIYCFIYLKAYTIWPGMFLICIFYSECHATYQLASILLLT